MPVATILCLNAASCLSFCLIFLAAPWTVAAFLGAASVWLIVSLGVALIVALGVGAMGRMQWQALPR